MFQSDFTGCNFLIYAKVCQNLSELQMSVTTLILVQFVI